MILSVPDLDLEAGKLELHLHTETLYNTELPYTAVDFIKSSL